MKMKSVLLTTMLAAVLAPVMYGQESKVYVWDFVVEGPKNDLVNLPIIAKNLTSGFEEALVKAKCYQVLQRRQYDRLFKHAANENSVANLPEGSKRQLKIIKAEFVVFGSMTNDLLQRGYKVSVTLENLASTQIKAIGSVLVSLGDLEDADKTKTFLTKLVGEICITAFTSNSDNKAELVAIANKLVEEKQWSKAIEPLKQIIKIDPSDSEAHRQLGDAYHSSRDYDRAIEAYTKWAELDSGDGAPYLARGNSHFANRKDPNADDKAIADYTEVINRNPNPAWAYFNRSVVYKKKGNIEKARADCRKALELDPKLPVVCSP